MLRYLAFVWRAANSAQADTQRLLSAALAEDTSSEWRNVLQAEGVSVFCCGDRPEQHLCQRLAGEQGVILGSIFETRPAATSHAAFCPDHATSRRIAVTSGKWLIESCWGSYVAIVRDPSKRVCVLRSPNCTLPCLHATFRGVQLIFAAPEDVPALAFQSLSINWTYLARAMLKLSTGNATGIQEISEIGGGECLHVQGEQTARRIYWDALGACAAPPIEDAAQAADMLRTTVKACVQTQAAGHDAILHRLSGGLDSSIVLGCLQDASMRPRIVCINRHSHGYEADERQFARLAAQRAQCELIEVERDRKVDFAELLQARVSHVPQEYIIQLGQYVPECAIARSLGATAVFCGDFGDQLFFDSALSLSVADHVHEHGIGAGLFSVALNAAQLEGQSVWRVLRQAVPQGLMRARWDSRQHYRKFDTLLREDVANDFARAADAACSWYDADRYVPPGKQYQISGLPSASGAYPPFEQPGDPDYVRCLFSQPIVELCLRIPTYVLTHGGWDRATARAAFANDVPADIIRRRSKGGQGDYTLELVTRNIDFVRTLLLDGMLVEQGLLDRRKLEEALSGRPSKLLKGTVRLRRYMGIELWLGAWVRHRKLHTIETRSAA